MGLDVDAFDGVDEEEGAVAESGGGGDLAAEVDVAGGVVHPKLAGRVRFMDYLDEEQRRAITMKSSSILLRYASRYPF